MSPTDCLQPDTLEALALGASAASAVEQHLTACSVCRKQLQQIRDDNALLRSFAGSSGQSLPDPPSEAAFALPGYQLLHEIERGGQGVVYAALQESTRRSVAIKVLRRGALATSQARARFEREVEILAGLDHPNIVTVHDAGSIAGCNYIVMDLVEGPPLDQWAEACRARHARTGTPGGAATELLTLFETICSAVHAAHLRGVMHRDLKPGNIRVAADGRPRVLDFGLAKPLEAVDATGMTDTGQFVGSLLWASPEQIRGAHSEVDLRTDVYALGVVLFHLLTGGMPFELDSNLHAGLDEMLTATPPLPSEVPTALPGCAGELDTIVHRCLAKDPERRYQGAGELASDIRRFLHGEPIEARRDSALYVLRKTLGRYRRRVLLAGGLLILAAVFSVVMTVMYQQSVRLERKALEDADSYARLLTRSNLERGRLAGVLGNFSEAESLLWQEFLRQRSVDPATAPLATPPGDPQAYWALWDLYRQHPCQLTIPLASRPRTALLTNGELVTVDSHGQVQTFGPDGTPKATQTLPGESFGLPQLHPRGQILSITPTTYQLWNSEAERALQTVPHAEGSRANATLSPSGRLLGVLHQGRVEVRDLRTDVQGAWFGTDVVALAFSHDDQQLATRDRYGRLVLWDLSSGRERATLAGSNTQRSTPQAADLAFGPGDDWLVDAWIGGPGRVIDLRPAAPTTTTLPVECGSYRVLGFGQDGARFAIGDLEGNVRVFGRDGLLEHTIAVGVRIRSVCFTPSGTALWIACDDRMQLWQLRSNQHVRTTRLVAEPHFHTVATTPNGDTLVAAGGSGQLRILAPDNTWGSVAFDNDSIIPSIALAPDGQALCAATYAGIVHVWTRPLASGLGAVSQRLEHPGVVSHVCYSPDGALLATAGSDGRVRIWDRAGNLQQAFACGPQRLPQLAFDSTSQRLAVASRDGSLWLWQRGNPQPTQIFPPAPQPQRAVAFTPGGQLLSGGDDRLVRAWDLSTARVARTHVGSAREIYCLTASPAGDLFASGEAGGNICLWSPEMERPLLVLEGHTSAVMSLTFVTPTRLLSASLDGTLQHWDLETYGPHIRGQVRHQLRDEDAAGAKPWHNWSAR